MQYSSKYLEMVNSAKVIYDPITGKFYTESGKERKMKIDHRGYLRFAAGKYGSLIADSAQSCMGASLR